MNSDGMNKQHCPNFGELLNNWKLRQELERERKRREEAELYGKALATFLSIFCVLVVIAVVLFAAYSGMSTEAIEAYARLFVSCSLLLFVINFTLLSVKIALKAIIRKYDERKKRNKPKNEAGKGEF